MPLHLRTKVVVVAVAVMSIMTRVLPPLSLARLAVCFIAVAPSAGGIIFVLYEVKKGNSDEKEFGNGNYRMPRM